MKTYNGSLISNIRKQKDMTLSEAAEKSHMSVATLKTIEQGGSTNTKNLEKICDLLDIHIADLYQKPITKTDIRTLNIDANDKIGILIVALGNQDKISSASIDTQGFLTAISNEVLKLVKSHVKESVNFINRNIYKYIDNPEQLKLFKQAHDRCFNDFITSKYKCNK